MGSKIKVRNVFPKEDDVHYFFGYYGKSPWSKDGKYVLGLKVNFIDRHPDRKDKVEILIKNTQTCEIKKIAETYAWNWQQGCMLQWIGPDFNSEIIFNDRDKKNGKLISRIINVYTNKERKIPFSFYDVSSDGKYALNISYGKLDYVRKGYGYEGGKEERFEKEISSDEGIRIINLKDNSSKLIVRLKDLYNYNYNKSMDIGTHWIDQPVFNPVGNRLCFLHRWEIRGGLFYSRFFSVDVDGNNLYCFVDSGLYSHFTWKNYKEILMWCSISNKFAKIRKGDKRSNFLVQKILPIYRKIVPRSIRKRALPVGYYLLKDQTIEARKINIYHEDGHPSFSKNKRYIITDTYPNSRNYRKLILFDWETKKRKILGNFYSLPDKKYLKEEIKDFGNSGFRVDLHPRWDMEGEKVCFDSIHEGYRNVYEIPLSLYKNIL